MKRTPSHGASRYNKLGCRCDECRAGKAAEMRAYAAKVRARDGQSPTQKYRPRQSAGVSCADCGVELRRLGKRQRCKSCAPLARDRRRAFASRWREMSRKAAKAAAGRAANTRWPLVNGTCAGCGEAFTRRGAASPYCSRSCNQSHRRAIGRKASGKWISDADRLAIYERDNWTCQICLDPVDREAHYQDAKAPSLDHIECQSWVLIPDHSPRNLRTACRLCNSLRGDETWSRAA